MAALLTLQRSFIDKSHVQFYSASGGRSSSAACGPSPQRRRSPRAYLGAATATPSEGRRARVLQHVADVESTLLRLEQAAPLAAAPRSLEQQTAAAPAATSQQLQAAAPSASQGLQSHQLNRAWSSSSSSSSSATSSDSSSSDSSSDSEGEGASVAARLSRRLAQQAELRRRLEQQASNIVAAQLPSHSAAAAAPAAAGNVATAVALGTTVVRVCQGKKCAAGGAAAVLAQYAAMPGVTAQPAKCLKQCRRCVAVEMASGSGPARACAALYTGVNGANAAEVLAMHRQRGVGPAAAAPAPLLA